MELTASRFDAIDASHERARRGRRARMDALEQKQEEVNAAGAQVRALKAQNADADAIAAAIAELKRLKVDLEKDLNALKEAGNAEAKAKEEFRAKLGQLLEGRLFYIPSFKIYGGVAGLYDYGPPGVRGEIERAAVLEAAFRARGEHVGGGVPGGDAGTSAEGFGVRPRRARTISKTRTRADFEDIRPITRDESIKFQLSLSKP